MRFLRKRELLITYSFERQAQVREILDKNSIEYQINTSGRNSDNVAARRGLLGSLGESFRHTCCYRIYVDKDDLERAQYLVR
mgnify:FL=1